MNIRTQQLTRILILMIAGRRDAKVRMMIFAVFGFVYFSMVWCTMAKRMLTNQLLRRIKLQMNRKRKMIVDAKDVPLVEDYHRVVQYLIEFK